MKKLVFLSIMACFALTAFSNEAKAQIDPCCVGGAANVPANHNSFYPALLPYPHLHCDPDGKAQVSYGLPHANGNLVVRNYLGVFPENITTALADPPTGGRTLIDNQDLRTRLTAIQAGTIDGCN